MTDATNPGFGTKAKANLDPASCWSKAAADEPVFVLRGNDPAAGNVVRAWAMHCQTHGYHDAAKIDDAYAVGNLMDTWHEAHTAKVIAPEPEATAAAK